MAEGRRTETAELEGGAGELAVRSNEWISGYVAGLSDNITLPEAAQAQMRKVQATFLRLCEERTEAMQDSKNARQLLTEMGAGPGFFFMQQESDGSTTPYHIDPSVTLNTAVFFAVLAEEWEAIALEIEDKFGDNLYLVRPGDSLPELVDAFTLASALLTSLSARLAAKTTTGVDLLAP